MDVNKERGEVGRSLLLERGGGSYGAVRGAHRRRLCSGGVVARAKKLFGVGFSGKPDPEVIVPLGQRTK